MRKEHVIDCNKAPFVPRGWQVEEHQKGGNLEWNPLEVRLYISTQQLRRRRWAMGDELRKELNKQKPLNANVLDYLLKNPSLIPEEWKEECVFFWGTIYRDSHGRLYVRYLVWDNGSWRWSYRWLGHDFGICPAAVRFPRGNF